MQCRIHQPLAEPWVLAGNIAYPALARTSTKHDPLMRRTLRLFDDGYRSGTRMPAFTFTLAFIVNLLHPGHRATGLRVAVRLKRTHHLRMHLMHLLLHVPERIIR